MCRPVDVPGVIFIFNDEDALRKGYAPRKAHTDYQAYTDPYIEGRSRCPYSSQWCLRLMTFRHPDKLIFDIYCEE